MIFAPVPASLALVGVQHREPLTLRPVLLEVRRAYCNLAMRADQRNPMEVPEMAEPLTLEIFTDYV